MTAMIGRKSIIGLCILCALAVGAFAAQGASASKGTTMFTCKSVAAGTGNFKGAHCKTSDAGTGAGANWGDVAVAQDTTTEVTATSANTAGECQPWIIRSTQSGVEQEFRSPCAHILAENSGQKSWATNKLDGVTGEHYITGEAWVDFTEVTVTKPAGKGCKVNGGGTLTSNKVKFTTLGQGGQIKVEPAAGGAFLVFELEGCSIGAMNGLYETKGSVKVQADGATVSATEANTTTQGTLTVRGQKAGAEGELTSKGKAPSDETDTGLSVTTVETP